MERDNWIKGRTPFRYQREISLLDEPPRSGDPISYDFVIRDCDDLWIAIVPLESWAQTITALLNENEPPGGIVEPLHGMARKRPVP